MNREHKQSLTDVSNIVKQTFKNMEKKNKEFKDMTLNDLLESDLSLDDIDEVIEEQLENEKLTKKGKNNEL